MAQFVRIFAEPLDTHVQRRSCCGADTDPVVGRTA